MNEISWCALRPFCSEGTEFTMKVVWKCRREQKFRFKIENKTIINFDANASMISGVVITNIPMNEWKEWQKEQF